MHVINLTLHVKSQVDQGVGVVSCQCLERKMKIAVVGIPKTIDNDLQLVDKTFGFDTSVEEAQRAINAAFVEVPM